MVVIFALCLAWYIFCVMPERAGSCALWPCCVSAAGKSAGACGFAVRKRGNGGAAAGTPPSEKLASPPFCPIAWVRDKSASLARAVARVCVWLGICWVIPEKWGLRYGENGGTKPKPAPNPQALADLRKQVQMEREKGAFAAV